MAKKPTQEELNNLMQRLGISQDEAMELWQDDHCEQDLPEVQELTAKAKKNIKTYVSGGNVRKHTTKVRKENKDKQSIIFAIFEKLNELTELEEVNIYNKEKEIDFRLNDIPYTVSLTAHTKKWKGRK